MQSIRIHRRVTAILAIVLAATAISASAASARVLDGPIHQTEPATHAVAPILPPAPATAFRADEGGGLGHISPVPATAPNGSAEPNRYAGPATPSAVVQVSKVAAQTDSFHWGDAAIGGAAAVAIVLLITAGTLVVRRRIQLGEA